MGDQHDALQVMDLNQETQLLDQAVFLAEGKEVTGEACRPARHHKTVAARKLQAVVEEIVDLFPEAPVAAIDRGGANAVLVETHRTLIHRATSRVFTLRSSLS